MYSESKYSTLWPGFYRDASIEFSTINESVDYDNDQKVFDNIIVFEMM